MGKKVCLYALPWESVADLQLKLSFASYVVCKKKKKHAKELTS